MIQIKTRLNNQSCSTLQTLYPSILFQKILSSGKSSLEQNKFSLVWKIKLEFQFLDQVHSSASPVPLPVGVHMSAPHHSLTVGPYPSVVPPYMSQKQRRRVGGGLCCTTAPLPHHSRSVELHPKSPQWSPPSATRPSSSSEARPFLPSSLSKQPMSRPPRPGGVAATQPPLYTWKHELISIFYKLLQLLKCGACAYRVGSTIVGD
jgi:hypothetical protein